MKIASLSQSNNKGVNKKVNPFFRSNLTKSDLAYKKRLIEGLKKNYGIKSSVESLKPILAPDELKHLLKKLSAKDYSLGETPNETKPLTEIFANVINRFYRVNLHIHTNNSDGKMSAEEFLEQSSNYANAVAKANSYNRIPPYTTAITDHNNIDGVKKIISMIAQNPDKYKNLKFATGCEFMFYDDKHDLQNPNYEAVGLGFNPFDEELNAVLSKENPVELIEKLKESGAVISYAHPLRFCQKQIFDENFLKYLISIGVNGIETNYQYYFKNTETITEQRERVQELARKYDLYETGGTDTHGKNIFHDKAEPIMNLVI